ncbi:MAG: efflux RND transporter periplasmic adaptor subunit [Acidimicrobiales bacterium]
MNKKKIAVSAFAVVAVASLVAFGGLRGGGKHGKKKKGGAGGITAVQAATARTGTASSVLTLSGTVAPTGTLDLSPSAAGKLASISVAVGQHVAAGQVVASMSSPVGQAQLAQAQAAVTTAQAKLQAAEAGPTPQAVAVSQAEVNKAQIALQGAQQQLQALQAPTSKATSSQLAAAQSSVAQAQAGVTLAQAQLAETEAPPAQATVNELNATVAQAEAAYNVVQAQVAQDTIAAPFAGVITAVPGVAGATATAATTVAILQTSQLTIQAPVNEQDVSTIKAGQHATITVPTSGQKLTGTVANVSPTSNSSSLTFLVTITPSTTPSWLMSGESASVDVVTQQVTGAVIVPTSAVVSINGTPQVFTITSSTSSHTVKLVNVTPSLSDGQDTVVTGLPSGSQVVAVGQTYLAAGDKVRVTQKVSVPASLTGSTVGGIITQALTAAPAATAGKAGGKAGGKGGA